MTRAARIGISLMSLVIACCAQPRVNEQSITVIASDPENILGQPGEVVPATSRVILAEQERVRFFDSGGAFHELTGPFSGVISEEIELSSSTPDSELMMEAIGELLQPTRTEERAIGATRGEGQVPLWGFSVTQFYDDDTICLPRDGSFSVVREVVGENTTRSFRIINEMGGELNRDFVDGARELIFLSKEFDDGVYMLNYEDVPLGTIQVKSIDPEPDSLLFLSLYNNECRDQFFQKVNSLTDR